jgi:hypothetical protein
LIYTNTRNSPPAPRSHAAPGREKERPEMSGTTGLSSIQLYTQYAANETKYATASVAANAQSTALIDYFKQVAPSLTTPQALLGNYKALTVVLGAFGLQDKIDDTAILKQLLTQDPSSKTSLAQQLGSAKYQLFAQALSNWNPPPFSTAAGINQIVAAYTTNSFETTAGQQVSGLGNALYFTREASSLTSIAQVQADSNLLDVVVTGLGLPLDNFEELSFAQQTSILTSKLPLSQLQNAGDVQRLAERYLISQATDANDAPAPGSTVALFTGTTDSDGDDLLSILYPDSNTNADSSSGTTSSVLSLFA